MTGLFRFIVVVVNLSWFILWSVDWTVEREGNIAGMVLVTLVWISGFVTYHSSHNQGNGQLHPDANTAQQNDLFLVIKLENRKQRVVMFVLTLISSLYRKLDMVLQ